MLFYAVVHISSCFKWETEITARFVLLLFYIGAVRCVCAACLMSADSATSAASGSSASTTSPQSFSLLRRAVIILFYERIHRKIGSRNR